MKVTLSTLKYRQTEKEGKRQEQRKRKSRKDKVRVALLSKVKAIAFLSWHNLGQDL